MTSPAPFTVHIDRAMEGPLASIIARLEAATEGSRELDAAIIRAVFGYADDAPLWHGLHYTTSLDSALTLVPSGWNWLVRDGNTARRDSRCFANVTQFDALNEGPAHPTWHLSPALALCIAALRARASREASPNTPE